MIHKETWLQEVEAAYSEPTPNDPGTLYRYVYPPHAFSIGYTIEFLTRDSKEWKEIKAGVLAEGLLTDRVMAALEAMPSRGFVPIKDMHGAMHDPPTWTMYLYGKYPFGPGSWNIFGMTSDKWETIANPYEEPFAPQKEEAPPRIRMELQFQVRPAKPGVTEWAPEQKPSEFTEEEDDTLFNSLVDALDTVRGIKRHELQVFLNELDEIMDEDEEVYERFQETGQRIRSSLAHGDANYLSKLYEYVLTGDES